MYIYKYVYLCIYMYICIYIYTHMICDLCSWEIHRFWGMGQLLHQQKQCFFMGYFMGIHHLDEQTLVYVATPRHDVTGNHGIVVQAQSSP